MEVMRRVLIYVKYFPGLSKRK